MVLLDFENKRYIVVENLSKVEDVLKSREIEVTNKNIMKYLSDVVKTTDCDYLDRISDLKDLDINIEFESENDKIIIDKKGISYFGDKAFINIGDKEPNDLGLDSDITISYRADEIYQDEENDFIVIVKGERVSSKV